MKKFATTAPVATVLDIPVGSIRFIAADRADATVEVLPLDASKGRDVKAAETTTVEYSDGVLRIAGAPLKNQILGRNPGAVEVTVQLPVGSSVEGKTASAEFRCVGQLGDIAYESAHGSIKIDEAASTRLVLTAGDVSLGRADGSAEINIQKGDISIAEAVRGTLTLHTEYGEISVGAVRGASASLDAGTSFGRVHNSLKNDGDTDLAIHASTSYGNITARSL